VGTIFKADQTVSFQVPKLAFLQPENQEWVGELHVVDIGLSKKYLREIEVAHFLTTLKSVRKIIKPRSRFDHKGKFGHALLIAGSTGKMGACILSTKAAPAVWSRIADRACAGQGLFNYTNGCSRSHGNN
jgi:hypothetical protein